MSSNNKWVACWGNATSITDQTACMYSKDITLRYPIRMCFDGSKIRVRLSNIAGKNMVKLNLFAGKTQLFFEGNPDICIEPGQEIETDECVMDIKRDDVIDFSIYLPDYTDMNSGVLITGPLSRGFYSYGNHALEDELPLKLTRKTNWFYFLNTIDIFTSEENHAIICYGDSITAQSWPDYLTLRLDRLGIKDTAVIRRAVSGTRILREYDCITYAAYGMKGERRFPVEINTAGADCMIIQHGINDIIHPVGEEVNPFRPWSDMPSLEDLIRGMEEIYVSRAREAGLRVYAGTLLPIYGWRTYSEMREKLKNDFNEYLRQATCFDGCIDFDLAVRDSEDMRQFAPGFDSSDHLHPSETAYEAMAECIPVSILRS